MVEHKGPKARRGKHGGGGNRGLGFTAAEINNFLDIMQEVVPVNPLEWAVVVDRHHRLFANRKRDQTSIKRKFYSIAKIMPSNGDPEGPAYIQKAKDVQRAIQVKKDSGVVTTNDLESEMQDGSTSDNDGQSTLDLNIIEDKSGPELERNLPELGVADEHDNASPALPAALNNGSEASTIPPIPVCQHLFGTETTDRVVRPPVGACQLANMLVTNDCFTQLMMTPSERQEHLKQELEYRRIDREARVQQLELEKKEREQEREENKKERAEDRKFQRDMMNMLIMATFGKTLSSDDFINKMQMANMNSSATYVVSVEQPSISIALKSVLKQGWSTLAMRFPVNRIYCVGRNFRDHAIEVGADPDREPPFFFQKPRDAAIDASSTRGMVKVPFPPMTKNLHYEVELVVAIGKAGRNIHPTDVPNHIFGYAMGCDLTRRDLQTFAKRDGKPWCASKGFDFSAPVSAIVPREEVDFLAPSNRNARITLEVNGTVRQDSTIDKMIWSIPEAVSILSQFYCLKPGDLVFTGTPSGIGPLHVGDVVRAKCDDILPECVFEVGPEST
jgi:fumarylpyruvate hydrolase